MNALAWTMILLEAAPYFIGVGIIALVIMIYKLWRIK